MRYTTATAFAAMMGMSALHAAPVGPNHPSGADHLGMPMVYDDSIFQEKTVSRLHSRTPDHFKTNDYRLGSAASEEARRRFPNLPTVNGKRETGGRRIGKAPEPVACKNCWHDGTFTTYYTKKREASPQRGRGAVNAVKGIGGALGFLSDGLTIHNAVTQKREASPQRGRGAVNAIKGIGGALGFLSDGLTIHNAVTQKREASHQRGRGAVNAINGNGGAHGFLRDGLTIHNAVTQKREASPQRGRGAVNAIKGIGGALGFLSDGLTIHNAVTQKREASFQRTHPGNTYENMPGLDTVEPNAIQQKRENLQNVATIDPNAIASLHNNGIPQKREASPSRIPIGDHTPGYTINFPDAGKDYSIGKREASPNRGDDNPISGHLATDPSYLKKENTKSIHETRDASRFYGEQIGGTAETDLAKVYQMLREDRSRHESIHQTRDASPQGYAETAADQTLRQLGFEKVHSKSTHETRDASRDGGHFSNKPLGGIPETDWDKVNEMRQASRPRDKSIHQTREAALDTTLETDQLVHPGWIDHKPVSSLLQTREAAHDSDKIVVVHPDIFASPLPQATPSFPFPGDNTGTFRGLKREAEAQRSQLKGQPKLPEAIGAGMPTDGTAPVNLLKREAEAQRNNGGMPYTNLGGELGINDRFGRNTLNEREAEPKNKLTAPSMTTDAEVDPLIIGYQKREAEAQRNSRIIGNTPTSKCPGYTCAYGPPAVDEMGVQMKYHQCC
ncbi:hypothetical protein PtrSN001A_010909 [Pyrenophora tritici-repentis]|nr:hypothetical protein PtrSN001A_010909 [Pyrenophora tritici-repentis]